MNIINFKFGLQKPNAEMQKHSNITNSICTNNKPNIQDKKFPYISGELLNAYHNIPSFQGRKQKNPTINKSMINAIAHGKVGRNASDYETLTLQEQLILGRDETALFYNFINQNSTNNDDEEKTVTKSAAITVALKRSDDFDKIHTILRANKEMNRGQIDACLKLDLTKQEEIEQFKKLYNLLSKELKQASQPSTQNMLDLYELINNNLTGDSDTDEIIERSAAITISLDADKDSQEGLFLSIKNLLTTNKNLNKDEVLACLSFNITESEQIAKMKQLQPEHRLRAIEAAACISNDLSDNQIKTFSQIINSGITYTDSDSKEKRKYEFLPQEAILCIKNDFDESQFQRFAELRNFSIEMNAVRKAKSKQKLQASKIIEYVLSKKSNEQISFEFRFYDLLSRGIDRKSASTIACHKELTDLVGQKDETTGYPYVTKELVDYANLGLTTKAEINSYKTFLKKGYSQLVAIELAKTGEKEKYDQLRENGLSEDNALNLLKDEGAFSRYQKLINCQTTISNSEIRRMVKYGFETTEQLQNYDLIQGYRNNKLNPQNAATIAKSQHFQEILAMAKETKKQNLKYSEKHLVSLAQIDDETWAKYKKLSETNRNFQVDQAILIAKSKSFDRILSMTKEISNHQEKYSNLQLAILSKLENDNEWENLKKILQVIPNIETSVAVDISKAKSFEAIIKKAKDEQPSIFDLKLMTYFEKDEDLNFLPNAKKVVSLYQKLSPSTIVSIAKNPNFERFLPLLSEKKSDNKHRHKEKDIKTLLNTEFNDKQWELLYEVLKSHNKITISTACEIVKSGYEEQYLKAIKEINGLFVNQALQIAQSKYIDRLISMSKEKEGTEYSTGEIIAFSNFTNDTHWDNWEKIKTKLQNIKRSDAIEISIAPCFEQILEEEKTNATKKEDLAVLSRIQDKSQFEKYRNIKKLRPDLTTTTAVSIAISEFYDDIQKLIKEKNVNGSNLFDKNEIIYFVENRNWETEEQKRTQNTNNLIKLKHYRPNLSSENLIDLSKSKFFDKILKYVEKKGKDNNESIYSNDEICELIQLKEEKHYDNLAKLLEYGIRIKEAVVLAQNDKQTENILKTKVKHLRPSEAAFLALNTPLTSLEPEDLKKIGRTIFYKLNTDEYKETHDLFAKAIKADEQRLKTPLTINDISDSLVDNPDYFSIENGQIIHTGSNSFTVNAEKSTINGENVLYITNPQKPTEKYVAYKGAIVLIQEPRKHIDRKKLEDSLLSHANILPMQSEILATSAEEFIVDIIDNDSECIIGQGTEEITLSNGEKVKTFNGSDMTNSETKEYYQKALKNIKDTNQTSVESILKLMPKDAMLNIRPYTTDDKVGMLYSISSEWESKDGKLWQLRIHSTELEYRNSYDKNWIFRLAYQDGSSRKNEDLSHYNFKDSRFEPATESNYIAQNTHNEIDIEPEACKGKLISNLDFQDIIRKISKAFNSEDSKIRNIFGTKDCNLISRKCFENPSLYIKNKNLINRFLLANGFHSLS